MKFCKIHEVFAVNEECQVEQIGDVLVIDNLFKNPDQMREFFLNMPAPMWKQPPGTRNFIDYYDCMQLIKWWKGYPFDEVIIKIIKSVYGKDTYHWDNVIRTTYFQQIKPKESDYGRIHYDAMSSESFTILINLNNQEESSGGTAFFKGLDPEGHNGDVFWSTQKITIEPLHIDMKPGRVLVYPTDLPHASWHEKDFIDFPRLNALSRFVTNRYDITEGGP
jgi:hypothetical protein